MTGVVLGLHVNPEGGVPKHPVNTLSVHREGCVGDKQNDRKHHGGPLKAVSILEQHVLEFLQTEGHPISPGSTGENVLIGGTKPGDLMVGTLLELGEVKLCITSDAPPCKTIKASFTMGDFNRLNHRKTEGQTRWYARVMREGSITVGDGVEVINEGGPIGNP
ncbi:MAG: MOSC domain-containing protein [Poseidonia sp.]